MSSITRRGFVATAAGAAAAAAVSGSSTIQAAADDSTWKVVHGRIKQSVCAWCFKPMPIAELAAAAAAMGLKSVELVDPKDWPILKQHGLVCAITSSHGFVKGWNHLENHGYCEQIINDAIEVTAAAGFPNVITFSGMRDGIDDAEGKRNTIAGLKKVIGLAEKKKVNLCIEMLNSRVNVEMKGHPGYQCDKMDWAKDVCDAVGSPRMKILFDIYHVQIMQGDVITRIRELKDYTAHYHTAGVPGRNDLDETQELNYPPIMQAIVETGYQGYVGQEFIPKGDKIAALRQAARLCDV